MSCTDCDCKDRHADTDEWVTPKRPVMAAEPVAAPDVPASTVRPVAAPDGPVPGQSGGHAVDPTTLAPADAPDPDAELVERMARAIDAEPGFNVSDMAYAALRALREIRDVTPRADTTRLYVAGPMTGLPGHNYATFLIAAHILAERGYEVECPTTVSDNDPTREPRPWDWYMRRTLALLLTCDAVALLDGWEHSRGARLEVEVAHALGMVTLPWHRWLDAGEETR